MRRRHIARFLEFLVIGILMGVTEDLIAIRLTTDEPFTAEMVLIVVLVAVPFAAFAELVIDREDIRPFEYALRRLGIGQSGSHRPAE